MTDNKIKLENVYFDYSKGKKDILLDVNFTINKGETIAFLGVSGCGKSTLLGVISNILNSENNELRGLISIFGTTPKLYKESGEIAFMFQKSNLMPNLTVRQNIEFPLKLRGELIIKENIDELLKIVGLNDFQNYYPISLSGGMKTRVSLARSFVTKPKLLLLDEPFSALDIAWRFELYEYLNKIKEKFKTTVLIVSHDIQEAILLADYVYVLGKKGNISDKRKVNKINPFTPSKVDIYLKHNQELFYELQGEIIRDARRNDLLVKDCLSRLKKIKELDIDSIFYNNLSEKESIITFFNSIKNQVNDNEVFEIIINFWKKFKSVELKYKLLWIILNNQNLKEEYHLEIKDFWLSNFDKIKLEAKKDEFSSEYSVEDFIFGRLNDVTFEAKKKWVYPYYFFSILVDIKDKDYAVKKINEMINNEKYSSFPYFVIFSKELLELIKTK